MNLRDKIWTWAETLDDWQNDLLRRIYEDGELDESNREQVLQNLIATIKEEELPYKPSFLKKDQIQTAISDDTSVKVLSLSNLENVGTVTEKGRLDFLPDGLTVIYGENGAGKSSYARVLKKACRAIDQDLEIYPNAFEESNKKGTAEIKIKKNGNTKRISRDVNAKPHPDLNSISIYDRECAEAYTEGNVMDIPYLPSDLRSMKQMVNEQNLIKESIQNDVNQIRKKIERLEAELEGFPQDDKIYPTVNSLSNSTDLEKLSELKGLNDQETERLEKLEKKLRASNPEKRQKKISALKSKKSDTKNIIDRLNKIDENLNSRLEEVFPELVSDIQTLKDSQEMLKEEFEKALPGTGNEAWKTLWKAARNFSAKYAYEGEEFPVLKKDGNPAKCVLCQQTLKESGIEERYEQFDKFIEHNIEKRLTQKREERDAYISEVENLKINDVLSEQVQNTLTEEDEELIEKLDEVQNILNARKDKIISFLKDEEWEEEIVPVPFIVKDKLSELVKEYLKQIKDYDNLKEQEERKKLQQKIINLTAKRELEEKFDVIKAIKEEKEKVVFLQKASGKLNSKPISNKVRKIGSDIADEIEEELKDYLRTFRVGHLPFEVKGKARSGETKSEMNLMNEHDLSPEDILSEGEQNSASLAYFLSEISHADHSGALVFDDPISSLDSFRCEYVAELIGDLSEERQIIVFTHDMFFLHLLLYQVSKRSIPSKTYYVKRTSQYAGVVEDNLPWEAKPISEPWLRVLKKDFEKLDGMFEKVETDKYRYHVDSFYQRLRKGWEKLVEEVLFKGVINRFDHMIHIGRIQAMDISETNLQKLRDSWSKCSRFVHHDSVFARLSTPRPNEIKRDLDLFIDLAKDLKEIES